MFNIFNTILSIFEVKMQGLPISPQLYSPVSQGYLKGMSYLQTYNYQY